MVQTYPNHNMFHSCRLKEHFPSQSLCNQLFGIAYYKTCEYAQIHFTLKAPKLPGDVYLNAVTELFFARSEIMAKGT